MRHNYIWILVVLLPVVSSANEIDTVAVTAIKSRMAAIDSANIQINDRLMVYCVDPDDQHLIPITDTSVWPDETLSTYNFIYDSLGALVEFVEFPTSESGDWSMSNSYYFYPSGRLMAFDHYLGTFISECTPVLRFTLTLYFSEAGEVLYRDAMFTDQENRPIDTSGCYNDDCSAEPEFYSIRELQFKIFKENYLGQEIRWPFRDPCYSEGKEGTPEE